MQHFIKKAAALALAMVMALSLATMALAADFEDMPTDWSANAVQSAVDNGLLSGKDGKIAASDNLTRAEMATIITRAFGAKVKDNISFTDVASDAWYADYVAQAAHMGVMNGSNGKFNPAANITRQEVFTVLARALKLADGSAEDLAVFSDGDKVASWAVPAVSALVKAGYVSGSNGALNPAANITRAEFAQVMYNIFNNAYLNQAGTYEEVDGKNVIISSTNVTVKGVEIEGDVVIADGVGDGDVFLEDVAIGGRVVVRGGGMNSVHFRGSKAGNVIVTKVDGNVRVVFDEESTVETVSIEGGKASTDVRLEGAVKNVVVNDAASTVVLADAKVEKLDVAAADAKISLAGATVVAEMTVAEGATNTTMTAEKTAEITKLTTAEDVFIDNTDAIKESNDDEKINPEKPAESGAPETSSAPSGGGAIEPDGDKTVAPSKKPVEYGEPDLAPQTTAPLKTPNIQAPSAAEKAEATGRDTTVHPADGSECTFTGTTTKQPTCTETGVQTYTCDACHATFTKEIPALGHSTYISEIKTQPTCTKTGVGVEKCSACSEVVNENAVILTRDHVEDATRVAYNSTKHWPLCKYCDAAAGAKVNHTGWTHEDTPGNVNGAQYHTVKCTCGYTKNAAHEWPETWTMDTNAEGADAGTHSHVCSDTTCDVKQTAKHTWGSDPVETPTADATGHYVKCTADGCTATHKVVHSYVNGECACGAVEPCADGEHRPTGAGTKIAATCTEGGKIKHTCSVCGAEYTVADPDVPNPDASAHKLIGDITGNWQSDAANHWKICDRCNASNAKVGTEAHSFDESAKTGACEVCERLDCCTHSFTPSDATGNCTICGKEDCCTHGGATGGTCATCGKNLDS